MGVAFGGRRPGEPPPRVAVLDLGTNTVLATVLFGDPREPRFLRIAEDLHFVTGLGRDRGPDGSLSEHGKRRARRALGHVARRLLELGVATSSVRAAATAACREAPDGPALLGLLQQELGLPFEVVDGDREAELVALAQRRAFGDRGPLVVVDIGGGSTEIALTGADDDWRVSLPTGATKLGEALGPRASRTDAARLAEERLAGRSLGPVPAGAALVGVAGTVTTALQVLDGSEVWDPERLHGRSLGRAEMDAVAARLFAASPAERRRIPGLNPGRADFLGPGLAWLAALMGRLGFDELLVSDRGVRFGLLHDAWPRAVVT